MSLLLHGYNNDFFTEIAKGNIPGHAEFDVFGERTSIGTTAAGEDVWEGSATTVPTPPGAGEQMTIVSTSANDAVAGTGAQKIKFNYLDGSGVQQSETVTLNGVTGVDTVATDISFVNALFTHEAGTGLLAAGDITIHKKGASGTVYNIIKANGNHSLVCVLKVPASKIFIIKFFYGSQTDNQPTQLRLRSTDAHGVLHAGIFMFKATMNLQNSSLIIPMNVKVPALSVAKVTAWAGGVGGNASAGFCGVLVNV